MTETTRTQMPDRSPAARPRSGNWPLVALIACGVVLAFYYWYRTRLPSEITIAGGPENGRYSEIAQGLARELKHRLGIQVTVVETGGSLENLRLIRDQVADLALYQPETQLILEGQPAMGADLPAASFVSNLYPEYLLPVRAVSGKADLNSLNGQIWSCNDRKSGDYAMTMLLVQHLFPDDSGIDVRTVSYTDLPDLIGQGQINIAVACCGLQTPMLKNLLRPDTAELATVPAVDALARKNTSLSRGIVPAGYFSTAPSIPKTDFATVTLQAQLVARTNASIRIVEEATRVIVDPVFQRRLELTELFDGGVEYAAAPSEFEMHPGAQHVFQPDLKPMINPDFVEGTEGLRSFIVSMLAAIWLLHRWWSRRQVRGQEHRLDRYIRELLDMERQQMDVDGEGGSEESQVLQGLLDQVTVLRQHALSEFTAHELNEDRAVDCFIEMCHALSDKINAKLLRHSVLSLKRE